MPFLEIDETQYLKTKSQYEVLTDKIDGKEWYFHQNRYLSAEDIDTGIDRNSSIKRIWIKEIHLDRKGSVELIQSQKVIF